MACHFSLSNYDLMCSAGIKFRNGNDCEGNIQSRDKGESEKCSFLLQSMAMETRNSNNFCPRIVANLTDSQKNRNR